MKTPLVISILALLMIAGAVLTDQLLTSNEGTEQAANELGGFRLALSSGKIAMLSADQFLRLIFVPAIVAAFVIASQFSGTYSPRPTQAGMARK